MPRTRHIAISLFCLLLAAPPLQMLLQLAPESPLYGVVSDAPFPSFSWHDVSRGTFQSAFETWLNQHMGFRTEAIRTECQINLSCFRESSIKTGDAPIIGEQNFVFARVYVDAFNRRQNLRNFNPDAMAQKLRRLQDGLQKRGKAFLFLISPSKAEIYPEYIPPRFTARIPGDAGTYSRLIEALNTQGVRTIDGHTLFMDCKAHSPLLLFPPGGIHWLPYSVAFVLEQTTRELERQIGRPMVHLTCDSITAASADMGGEYVDVASMLNTWSTPHWDVRIPDPCFSTPPGAEPYRPRLLMVGDSFAFGLINLMQRYKVTGDLDLYYYYSKLQRYPGNAISMLDKAGLDWEREVFSKDAVIIEINEVQLDSEAWGFVDDALRYLDANPVKSAAGRNVTHGT